MNLGLFPQGVQSQENELVHSVGAVLNFFVSLFVFVLLRTKLRA